MSNTTCVGEENSAPDAVPPAGPELSLWDEQPSQQRFVREVQACKAI